MEIQTEKPKNPNKITETQTKNPEIRIKKENNFP
jgi:hypothetical protein